MSAVVSMMSQSGLTRADSDCPAPATQRFCAFLVAGRVFAVDAARVTEVLRGQLLTPVPQAHPALRGLLNLRGRIVPAIDMRLRLGFDPARADASHTNIVATVAGEYFSLMVDQLVDVIEIPLAAIEQPTADSEDPSRDSVAAVYAAPSGLIYVLDVDQLVAGISDTGFERNMR